MTDHLNTELALLYACERDFKIPAAPIVRQLIAESERPLPDVLPKMPKRRDYRWPKSGMTEWKRSEGSLWTR